METAVTDPELYVTGCLLAKFEDVSARILN